MGVDDRQPVITLQEDLCILSTEVMWVGEEKWYQPGEAYVRMGRMKALYKVHKDSFDGFLEAEAIERKARNRLWNFFRKDKMMFERKSAVKGYTEKGWIRVKFKWGVKNV